MNYSKPDVVVLGNAADVIKGSRVIGSEPANDGLQGTTDCELDD